MNVYNKLAILQVSNTIITVLMCLIFYFLIKGDLKYSPIKEKLKNNFPLKFTLALVLIVAMYFISMYTVFLILTKINI